MVFSSIVFILYFLPVFLLAYKIADRKYKNLTLLFFSIVFYSWGAPKFIFVILGTTFLDFHLVKWMNRSENPLHRKIMLSLSVAVNLGLLFYFKYSNFFIDNVNQALGLFGFNGIVWTKLILPIGISFYTFETITYVVDVYRKIHKPLQNFWDYLVYILLFPKLIAGPIVRYHDLADQIKDRQLSETSDNFLIGFYRFAIGLSKKVLIANHMGQHADILFTWNYADLDTWRAWSTILAYTFQIYFDFSGYSDMAIGISQMIGFKIPENFNNPYTAISITDFWRRWHISLGNWMREYLYIPLGGNRVNSKFRLYLNLWLVFLASGLWHGASWSFVLWGAYHGLFLVLERMFLGTFYNKLGTWIPRIITFFLVCIGWVFFRIDHIGLAWEFTKRLLAFDFHDFPVFDAETNFYFILGFIFSFWSAFPILHSIQNEIYFKPYGIGKHLLVFILCFGLILVSIANITGFNFNPFIYFRF
ncbi:MAG: MBOAT family protein [Bacteroidia bacterium]|nr:MBOAT family protein [Bacteroidia bacterium]